MQRSSQEVYVKVADGIVDLLKFKSVALPAPKDTSPPEEPGTPAA
jgi:hypothetical protein